MVVWLFGCLLVVVVVVVWLCLVVWLFGCLLVCCWLLLVVVVVVVSGVGKPKKRVLETRIELVTSCV